MPRGSERNLFYSKNFLRKARARCECCDRNNVTDIFTGKLHLLFKSQLRIRFPREIIYGRDSGPPSSISFFTKLSANEEGTALSSRANTRDNNRVNVPAAITGARENDRQRDDHYYLAARARRIPTSGNGKNPAESVNAAHWLGNSGYPWHGRAERAPYCGEPEA